MVGNIDITEGVQPTKTNLESEGLKISSDVADFMGHRISDEERKSISGYCPTCRSMGVNVVAGCGTWDVSTYHRFLEENESGVVLSN